MNAVIPRQKRAKREKCNNERNDHLLADDNADRRPGGHCAPLLRTYFSFLAHVLCRSRSQTVGVCSLRIDPGCVRDLGFCVETVMVLLGCGSGLVLSVLLIGL